MTARSPTPTVQVAPNMVQPPDTASPATPDGALAATVRPSLRGQVAENPLTSILGSVIVALLGFTLVSSNVRIARLEDKVDAVDERLTAQNAKIDELEDTLEDKIDERFAVQDARIDGRLTAQDVRINELDDKIDGRFAAQVARMDELEDKLDERFAAQDATIDDISLKLTALIAGLGMTGAVDAAVDGPALLPSVG